MRLQIKVKDLNATRSRNSQRFPHDFAFRLSDHELSQLRLKSSTAIQQMRDMIRSNPWAYTEEGVAMIVGRLQTDIAITASVHLMRVFRDTRGLLKSQQRTLALLAAELIEARPLWQKIKHYKVLGLNHAEIGKLTHRSNSTIRKHVRKMEGCGLLTPPSNLAAMRQSNLRRHALA